MRPGSDGSSRIASRTMSVVKINAISVPEGGGAELEKRFAARAGAVEQQPGFEEFQLLRPTATPGEGGEDRYFVYTRWDSEESFQAWVNSQAFAHGHTGASSGGQGGDHPHGESAPKPVSTGAHLLAFEVVQQVVGPPTPPAQP